MAHSHTFFLAIWRHLHASAQSLRVHIITVNVSQYSNPRCNIYDDLWLYSAARLSAAAERYSFCLIHCADFYCGAISALFLSSLLFPFPSPFLLRLLLFMFSPCTSLPSPSSPLSPPFSSSLLPSPSESGRSPATKRFWSI